MHVQTIPKSPPKIIVQVAKVVTFFLPLKAKAKERTFFIRMSNFQTISSLPRLFTAEMFSTLNRYIWFVECSYQIMKH